MGLANKATFYPAPARSYTGAIASQTITVTTGATTASAYDTGMVSMVTFDVQDQPVRVRWDGSAPTATSGHVLPADSAYTWSVHIFNNAQFIRDSAASGNATIFASPVQD